jgi:hypothetical protein
MSLRGLLAAAWSRRARKEAAERRDRGRAGEERVARVLDHVGRRHRLRVYHNLRLTTRDGRRGDLDHVIVLPRRPLRIVAIETKAERPDRRHLVQVEANARRASRRYFRHAPQHRIVVHPNSDEAIVFDATHRAVRMGLPRLEGYLEELLRGAHADRLAA